MERFSFAAPTRVKVLVVPVGPILPADFDRYFSLLKLANDIRLLDVSPLPDSRYFNPQLFPQGHVFYDVSTRLPDEDTAFLHDFEPFRKTLVVVGLGLCLENTDSAVALLRSQYPTAIVHTCIYFNAPDNLEKKDSDCFYLTNAAELVITSMETIMCDITAKFLKALDSYASSYENITLRSPVSLTDGNVLTRTINFAQKRLSAGSSLKVSFSNAQGVPAAATQKDLKLRTLQRHSGRQAKLMGNFFLLAGRCNDALQYFTDAAINCKKAEDYLWLASALEGLAVASLVLLFLDLPHQVQNPMLSSVLQVPRSKNLTFGNNAGRSSGDSLASRLSVAIASPRNSIGSNSSLGLSNSNLELSKLRLIEFIRLLCQRSSQFYQLSTADMEDCVPDVVYVESLLRNIKFMIAVYLAGGDNTVKVLESVILSQPIEKSGSSDAAIILKGEIVGEVQKIFLLQLVDLNFNEQCHVYCALASIYSDLGLHRKEAFILRILLVALSPKGATIEDAASLIGDGSQRTIRSIFEILFRSYKISTETESSETEAQSNYSNWSTLQLQMIKICLRVAEGIRDYETLAKLCVLTFSRYSHCLPADDQIKLKEKLNWLSLLLKNEANSIKIPHSDPFIVRDATLTSVIKSSDLIPLANGVKTVANGGTDSVFFDPYKSQKVATCPGVIGMNVVQQLVVTLQNPFLFDLVVTGVDIVTEGDVKVQTYEHLVKRLSVTPFGSKGVYRGMNGRVTTPSLNKPSMMVESSMQGSHLVTVPANSFSQISVAFRALSPGELCIRALSLTIGNSQPQEFSIIGHENTCELQRVKFIDRKTGESNLDTLDQLFDNLENGRIGDRATTKTLQFQVIPPQPTLTITKNSVTSGWLMLLEGEKLDFYLELKNTSPDSINYLSFSFWDSTTELINSKLNLNFLQANYTAEDIYELEWQLLRKKAFVVKNKEELASSFKIISPETDIKIDYEVCGKRGMTELRLVLEYGNKSAEDTEQNYAKSVIVPLNISVHPSLEIIGCDVLPIFSTSLKEVEKYMNGTGDVIQDKIDSLVQFIKSVASSEHEDISAYCFLVLDIRNLWKDKLAAHIVNEFALGQKFEAKEVIELTKTARFILPVHRVSQDKVDLVQPIPSLRNKQFIKNYNLTDEEEQQLRLSFWVRCAILETVKGFWTTVGLGGERLGDIDLRCIRLNPAMTNSLLHDSILMQHLIYAEGEKEPLQKENNSYVLQRETFYTLNTKISNYTSKNISGTLRHIPFPLHAVTKQDLSIEQKILYNGVLQKHIGKDSISPGESIETKLGFMVLEKGQYEWGCVLDVFSELGKRVVGREPVYITAL